MGRDDTHLNAQNTGYYSLFWSWDAIDQWTGTGQTGDACALFDKRRRHQDRLRRLRPGQRTSTPTLTVVRLVQQDATHPVYSCSDCSDAKPDRCTQPSASASPTQDFPTQADAGGLGDAQPRPRT